MKSVKIVQKVNARDIMDIFFFLHIGIAIFQSIGIWGQETCFQCHTRDSSTLTNALVTSYFHAGNFRAILSCNISNRI